MSSTQHTPGRLIARNFSIYAADGKTPVADTCLIASVADCDIGNARRLVAAWNACEGIDTEVLENLLLMGDTFKSRFAARDKAEDELAAEVAALKALRDELARAASDFTLLADRVARLNPDAGEIGAGMLAQLVADARAAIASTTAPQQTGDTQ